MGTLQEKIAKQIQKDMAEILQQHTLTMAPGKMLTISVVRITPDFSIARINVSVFPSENSKPVIDELNAHVNIFRNELGKRMRHQLRKLPDLKFYLDDSLDYLNTLDNLLK